MADQKDIALGELAIESGYLIQAELDEALRVQKKIRDEMGMDQPLIQVLVSKKFLTLDQAQEVRHAAAIKSGEASIVAGYQIVTKLGEGGMGAVYKARKIESGQYVALKILPPSLATDELIKRFKREAEITSKLDHKHIVRCVEFGQDPKRKCCFCALELIEGEDLGKLIERKGRLGEDEAVSITQQIASAIQHAFYNGLVHRDVKPENIMVTPDGTAKLLDLGLARPASSEATRMTESGMFVGSPYYASPEQALGEKELDIRTDIYSLGGTLYHMVTGEPPFEGTTPLAILQRHVEEKLPWPAEVNPELSDGLCRIIAKMMEKSPDDRYQIPNDLHHDLDLLVEGEEPEVQDAALKNSSVKVPAVRSRRRRPVARAGAVRERDRKHPKLAGRDRREKHADRGEPMARTGGRLSPGAIAGIAAGSAALIGILAVMILSAEREQSPERDTHPSPPVTGRTGERGHDAHAISSPPLTPGDTALDVPGSDGRTASPRKPGEEERAPDFGRSLFGPGGTMNARSAELQNSGVVVPPSGDPRPLGVILCEMGAATEQEVREALAAQKAAGGGKKLGQILVELGFATHPQVGEAIRLQEVLPKDAKVFGGHWYGLCAEKMKWHTAKSFCERLGGHLVTIASKEENDFVAALARPEVEKVWIGFTDKREEGKWEWVTGEPVSFERWDRKQPDNLGGKQHHGYLGVKTALWDDCPGFMKKGLVCEWEPASPPPPLTLDFDGGVTMEVIYIAPGVFMMGGKGKPRRPWEGIEEPVHEVAITRGFYVGKYEVTQAQYEAVMGKNPSKRKEPDRPVECVNWGEAAEFCRLAGERTRRQIRLLTEAEWEYSCRAGSTGRWCFEDEEAKLGEYAWYKRNSGGQTHPVGQRKPNAWGLHDMHGNVREWCADRYGAGYYANGPRDDPRGPAKGKSRVIRGGAFSSTAYGCRSAIRSRFAPSHRTGARGFRVAVSVSAAGAPAEPAQAVDLIRGLVGHWKFDDDKGTKAHDSSGSGNHGTVKGGAKWVEGKLDGALNFDGRDDCVSAGAGALSPHQGTIVVWWRVQLACHGPGIARPGLNCIQTTTKRLERRMLRRWAGLGAVLVPAVRASAL